MHLRLAALFLIAESIFTYTNASEVNIMNLPTIHKSARDNRQYQAIKLDNQMTVLLVSDSDASKSLAALALPVGSLQDPHSQQGLAHYLEHMIFMGSKNYPQAHSFSDFLNKHAGSYNASTAATRTAYYLEVESSALDEAVIRLADAIAYPLFDKTYADKERNAVNAELTMSRSRDGMRMAQVTAETINQQHPSAMFFGGNLETLSDKKGSVLHDELLAFYDRYYSANLMVGVLYGKQSLTQLAALAKRSFGQINNRHKDVAPLTVSAITDKEKGLMIHYQPVKPLKLIQLQFPIEDNTKHFREKTDTYLSYLITSRSENTLADYLKKQGLIESIHAGADPDRFGNGGLFVINVNLTDKGLQNREWIITAIFNYLQQIKQQGISDKYYQEISKVLQLDFLYPDINRDMRYVEELTDNLLRYPIEHVLDIDYVADQFNSQAVNERINQLIPQNVRVWYISQNEPTNKEAYFVQAPYKVEPLAANLLTKWQQPIMDVTFNLPELNSYIPDNFTVVNHKPSTPAKPALILEETGLNVFYQPSYYFSDEPKISLLLNLQNPEALATAKNQILMALLDYLAGKQLDQLRFQASVAGISFSSTINKGLQVSMSGFSQHLPELLQNAVSGFQHFTLTPELLVQAKSWYYQQLDAAESGKAYEQAIQIVQQLTNVPYFERNERRHLVERLTLQDVEMYRQQFFSALNIELLVGGNITAEQTINLAQKVKQQLACRPLPWFATKIVDIGKPLKASIIQYATSTDSALLQLLVVPQKDEFDTIAYNQVLSKILQPLFFDELRSKQQLGYAVFNFPLKLANKVGQAFLIQSNSQGPAYLYQQYQHFYQFSMRKLAGITEKEIEQYKQGVMNEMQQPPQTLDDELREYMNDYQRHRLNFDSKQRVLTRIKNIDKSSLLAFYARLLSEQQFSLLSQVVGKQPLHKTVREEDYQSFDSTSALQRALPHQDKQ